MVANPLNILLGVAGAALGPQAPGFTLQYMQNLQGQIDSLKVTVARHITEFGAYGYSPEGAMKECAGATGLLGAFCKTFLSDQERYELLTASMARREAAHATLRPLILVREAIRDGASRPSSNTASRCR